MPQPLQSITSNSGRNDGAVAPRRLATVLIRALGLLAALLPIIVSGAAPAQSASLRKLDEEKRGEISRLSVAGLFYGNSDLFVTAVRDSEDKLRVLVWRVDNAGQAEVKGNVATDGTIEDVAVVSNGERRFVTVLRDRDHTLRLIAWRASADGAEIERLGTAVTGIAVTSIAAGAVPHTINAETGEVAGRPRVFVAARLPDGHVLVQHWDVTPDGELRKEQELRAERNGVAAAADGFQSMLAMQNENGDFRLTFFEANGWRGKTATGGAIRDVRVALLGSTFCCTGEAFTFSIDSEPTAVRTGANCLSGRLLHGDGLGKIIGWRLETITPNAPIVRTRERQLTDFGGISRAADLIALDDPGFLVTAHLGYETFCRALPRDQGKPRMQVTVYDLRADEDSFAKVAEADLGGDYTHIDASRIARSPDLVGPARFVIALRGVRGELKVTVWQVAR